MAGVCQARAQRAHFDEGGAMQRDSESELGRYRLRPWPV